MPGVTEKVSLQFSTLTTANFQGSALAAGSLLYGSDLTGANFRSANMSNTNLTNVNLTNADLTGAVLPAANFRTGVKWSNTTCPNGTVTSTGC